MYTVALHQQIKLFLEYSSRDFLLVFDLEFLHPRYAFFFPPVYTVNAIESIVCRTIFVHFSCWSCVHVIARICMYEFEFWSMNLLLLVKNCKFILKKEKEKEDVNHEILSYITRVFIERNTYLFVITSLLFLHPLKVLEVCH